MSLDDVRGPVEYWRKLARTSGGMQPPDIDVAVADAEALVELADAARRHLSDQQPGCRCEYEMADALARLDGDSGGAA